MNSLEMSYNVCHFKGIYSKWSYELHVTQSLILECVTKLLNSLHFAKHLLFAHCKIPIHQHYYDELSVLDNIHVLSGIVFLWG